MKEHCLNGKVISALKIASDKGAIMFITNDGDVIARAEGECCSHTWIEHISLPSLGFPATVSSVENIDMPDLGSPYEYDVVAYYGCKIVTDRGDIVIDYRNASNGYYGGNLSWPDEYFYGWVYGQNKSDMDWKDITEDI